MWIKAQNGDLIETSGCRLSLSDTPSIGTIMKPFSMVIHQSPTLPEQMESGYAESEGIYRIELYRSPHSEPIILAEYYQLAEWWSGLHVPISGVIPRNDCETRPSDWKAESHQLYVWNKIEEELQKGTPLIKINTLSEEFCNQTDGDWGKNVQEEFPIDDWDDEDDEEEEESQ